jgi:hypothetical protein
MIDTSVTKIQAFLFGSPVDNVIRNTKINNTKIDKYEIKKTFSISLLEKVKNSQ